MKIEKIEVFVIGPEDIHYTWSEDIPEIYQTNTIICDWCDQKQEELLFARKNICDIIFWKLTKYSCVLVKRDSIWFNKIAPDIIKFWRDVEIWKSRGINKLEFKIKREKQEKQLQRQQIRIKKELLKDEEKKKKKRTP